MIKSEDNPDPKYEFIKNLDEVWFVIDTDEWGDKIKDLRKKCESKDNRETAQSNPCFQVWLYYHFHEEKAEFGGLEYCKNWKIFLNNKIKGDFDSRRHPILIHDAIENSKMNYGEIESEQEIGCTQVFRLSKSIYPLVKDKIQEVRDQINEI